MIRLGLLLAALALPTAAGSAFGAADPTVDVYGEIQNPALQARYERVTHDLRCLVCQYE